MDGSRIVVFLWLCIVSLTVNAAELRRCIGRDGQISYQSGACGAGQRLDRILTYQPEPDTPALLSQPVNRYRKRNASFSRKTSSPRYRYRAAHLTTSERCRRAKQQRKAKLEKLGLHRTFDQLSRIDAAVRAVCRW